MKFKKTGPADWTVISAINDELKYVDSLAEIGRSDDFDHGVEGQLVTLGTLVRMAQDDWTMNTGPEPSLDKIRKVAAAAIRALMLYGCPRREVS